MAKRPYEDSQWPRVRELVLDRDGYRCRIRGPKCEGRATEADHIVPWQDGGAWFEPANLRAACKPCNIARANRSKHREGWRRSKTRVMLVIGPPAAGKTTYVQEHAGPRDLVVDYDLIAQALGSATTHDHDDHDVVNAARNAALNRIRRGEVKAPRAWIVSANPKAETLFPHHEVIVVDPGREEALRRCRESERPQAWLALVDDWYGERDAVAAGPSREW